MATVTSASQFVLELADLFSSTPTPERVLSYKPSDEVQRRASELLDKQQCGTLSEEESRELDEFAHAELLMRLIKAKLRAAAKHD